MVPQGNGLAAVLSAHENVLMPLLARAVEPGAAAARAAEALDAVGLGEIHSHLVEELSGGQQQRVAVARGLALASPVLLADEPTSELDHASRAVVLTLLRARAEAGAAVVMTTHDPEAAEAADQRAAPRRRWARARLTRRPAYWSAGPREAVTADGASSGVVHR